MALAVWPPARRSADMISTFESSAGKFGRRMIVSVALIPTPTTSTGEDEGVSMERLSSRAERSAREFRGDGLDKRISRTAKETLQMTTGVCSVRVEHLLRLLNKIREDTRLRSRIL